MFLALFLACNGDKGDTAFDTAAADTGPTPNPLANIDNLVLAHDLLCPKLFVIELFVILSVDNWTQVYNSLCKVAIGHVDSLGF